MIKTRSNSIDNSAGIWNDMNKNTQLALRDGTGVLNVVINSDATSNSRINVPTQYQGWNFIPFKSYEPQGFDESGIVIPSLLRGYKSVRFQHALE
jgi:hypothetical protein